MSTVLIALIVGAVVGLIVGINQHYRVSNYRNPFVLRNADGLARIHRRTRMDGVRTAEGGG